MAKGAEALGLVETYGIVFVIYAADAMVKAADVELIGFENTASGYISVLVEALRKITALYKVDKLLPYKTQE